MTSSISFGMGNAFFAPQKSKKLHFSGAARVDALLKPAFERIKNLSHPCLDQNAAALMRNSVSALMGLKWKAGVLPAGKGVVLGNEEVFVSRQLPGWREPILDNSPVALWAQTDVLNALETAKNLGILAEGKTVLGRHIPEMKKKWWGRSYRLATVPDTVPVLQPVYPGGLSNLLQDAKAGGQVLMIENPQLPGHGLLVSGGDLFSVEQSGLNSALPVGAGVLTDSVQITAEDFARVEALFPQQLVERHRRLFRLG